MHTVEQDLSVPMHAVGVFDYTYELIREGIHEWEDLVDWIPKIERREQLGSARIRLRGNNACT